MGSLEAWGGAVLLVCGLGLLARPAGAQPTSAPLGQRAPAPGRVEIALIGKFGNDPVLFERIRSLFPPNVAVVLRDSSRLDAGAVLRPERADTVYLWIRVNHAAPARGGQARVYLALRELNAEPRYLFRELGLDAGLDEVGSETLAQVAHSSTQALWLREQQTSRGELLTALESEAVPPPLTPKEALSLSPPLQGTDALNNPAQSVGRVRIQGGSVEPAPIPLRFGLGAHAMAHLSGAEGLLPEGGAFVSLDYRERISFRVVASYLLSTEFDVAPARVRLSGPSAELRAGWRSSRETSRPRLRLEAGLGMLFAHVKPSVGSDQVDVNAGTPADFERPYAVAGAHLEWQLGLAWLGAGADLRVPLRKTSYEVQGQTGAIASPRLSPGIGLEVGFLFGSDGK